MNPRPEITLMAASTCVVGLLISMPVAKIDTLHRHPVVFISPGTNDRVAGLSRFFRLVLSGRRHHTEVTYILGSHTNRGGKADSACNIVVGSYEFAQIFYQANCASWACHHHRSHPVETDRPLSDTAVSDTAVGVDA